MIVKTYNQKGEEVGKTKLPDNIFKVKFNHDLVNQAVIIQTANARVLTAHAKGRAEVRGGGKKPWRQKGTGRARHGSIRSPLWKGGGVTFGPNKERVFAKKISKKMKRKALFMVFSSKVKGNELIVLDKLEAVKSKTKSIFEILANLFKKLTSQELKIKNKNIKKSLILIIESKKDIKLERGVKNLPFAKVVRADSLNVMNLLNYKYVLMPKEAVGIIEKIYGIS